MLYLHYLTYFLQQPYDTALSLILILQIRGLMPTEEKWLARGHIAMAQPRAAAWLQRQTFSQEASLPNLTGRMNQHVASREEPRSECLESQARPGCSMTLLCDLGQTLLSGLAPGFLQGWLCIPGLKVSKLCKKPINHSNFIFLFLYFASHHWYIFTIK